MSALQRKRIPETRDNRILTGSLLGPPKWVERMDEGALTRGGPTWGTSDLWKLPRSSIEDLARSRTLRNQSTVKYTKVRHEGEVYELLRVWIQNTLASQQLACSPKGLQGSQLKTLGFCTNSMSLRDWGPSTN